MGESKRQPKAKKQTEAPATAPAAASERPRAFSSAKTAKDGLLDRLFKPSSAKLPAKRPSKLEELRSKETVITPPSAPPAAKALGKHQQPTRSSRVAAKPKPGDNRLGIHLARGALILALLALLWKGAAGGKLPWEHTAKSPGAGPVASETDVANALSDRVSFHRQQLGHRLNRERIEVEYENQQGGNSPNDPAYAAQGSDMMSGLPLAPEPFHRRTSRDRLEPANPDYVDSQIESQLREQQQVNAVEALERKRYIEEFVANAARAGYKVRIDKNGGVVVTGRVDPARNPSAAQSGSSQPGSAR